MKTTKPINHLPWSKPTTLILALLLGLSAEVATAQIIYTLDVPATTPWMDTGINLAAGSRLDITATGTVHYSTSSYQVCNANGGDYTGAQFLFDVMLPNTVCHSLLGKIDGTTDVGTGRWFRKEHREMDRDSQGLPITN